MAGNEIVHLMAELDPYFCEIVVPALQAKIVRAFSDEAEITMNTEIPRMVCVTEHMECVPQLSPAEIGPFGVDGAGLLEAVDARMVPRIDPFLHGYLQHGLPQYYMRPANATEAANEHKSGDLVLHLSSLGLSTFCNYIGLPDPVWCASLCIGRMRSVMRTPSQIINCGICGSLGGDPQVDHEIMCGKPLQSMSFTFAAFGKLLLRPPPIENLYEVLLRPQQEVREAYQMACAASARPPLPEIDFDVW